MPLQKTKTEKKGPTTFRRGEDNVEAAVISSPFKETTPKKKEEQIS